jgi:hypothetical protein
VSDASQEVPEDEEAFRAAVHQTIMDSIYNFVAARNRMFAGPVREYLDGVSTQIETDLKEIGAVIERPSNTGIVPPLPTRG